MRGDERIPIPLPQSRKLPDRPNDRSGKKLAIY